MTERSENEVRDRYLDLVQHVVLNEINPENGLRIDYLLRALVGSTGQDRNQLIGELVNIDTARASGGNDWEVKRLAFPFSMVSPERAHNTRHAAETVVQEGIPGDLVETGVWRGGMCILMKAVVASFGERRRLYVCDSFTGLPKGKGVDAELDLDLNPMLAAPLPHVRRHFERMGLLDDDVVFVEGLFDATMPRLAKNGPEKIAVLRLDGDYYDSTWDVLVNLYDKVSPGGFVIIDDYHAYSQCQLAVHDFFELTEINPRLEEIDGTGVYWRRNDAAEVPDVRDSPRQRAAAALPHIALEPDNRTFNRDVKPHAANRLMIRWMRERRKYDATLRVESDVERIAGDLRPLSLDQGDPWDLIMWDDSSAYSGRLALDRDLRFRVDIDFGSVQAGAYRIGAISSHGMIGSFQTIEVVNDQ